MPTDALREFSCGFFQPEKAHKSVLHSGFFQPEKAHKSLLHSGFFQPEKAHKFLLGHFGYYLEELGQPSD
jgi:hypothetical protein